MWQKITGRWAGEWQCYTEMCCGYMQPCCVELQWGRICKEKRACSEFMYRYFLLSRVQGEITAEAISSSTSTVAPHRVSALLNYCHPFHADEAWKSSACWNISLHSTSLINYIKDVSQAALASGYWLFLKNSFPNIFPVKCRNLLLLSHNASSSSIFLLMVKL